MVFGQPHSAKALGSVRIRIGGRVVHAGDSTLPVRATHRREADEPWVDSKSLNCNLYYTALR